MDFQLIFIDFSSIFLEVLEGDLSDDLLPALSGAQAVLCTVGPRPDTAPGPLAPAMPALVRACRKCGVDRLIVQAFLARV